VIRLTNLFISGNYWPYVKNVVRTVYHDNPLWRRTSSNSTNGGKILFIPPLPLAGEGCSCSLFLRIMRAGMPHSGR
jgi:hypothetical protein